MEPLTLWFSFILFEVDLVIRSLFLKGAQIRSGIWV